MLTESRYKDVDGKAKDGEGEEATERSESGDVSSDQATLFLCDHGREVDSYPKEVGSLLKGFKQGNNMIVFAFWLLCGKQISWE